LIFLKTSYPTHLEPGLPIRSNGCGMRVGRNGSPAGPMGKNGKRNSADFFQEISGLTRRAKISNLKGSKNLGKNHYYDSVVYNK
jgi:hypothetical protein